MKSLLDENVARLGGALEKFPFENVDRYADWLAQTYYYVRHSTRLLAAAAARFGFDELDDSLHQRFIAHMGEEKRHERLALHDLFAIGRIVDRHPERDSTRAFWEPQYYKIEHEDPIALFGYILALEGMSATHGKRAYERAAAAHSPTAATFLKVHAADDVEHVQKAIAMVERLDERRRRAVEINLAQSTSAYLALLADLER